MGATNSWLYVPLLHAAAGRLCAHSLSHWRAAALWWEAARAELSAAAPAPPSALLAFLEALPADGAAVLATQLHPASPRRRRRRPRRTHGTAPGPGPATAGFHGDDTDSTLSSVARALDHAAAQRAEVDAKPGASEGEASSAARQAAHPLLRVPRASWAWLDTVELAAEFASAVPTLQGVPGFMLPEAARSAPTMGVRFARCAPMTPGRGPRRCALGSFSCCCPGCCSHAAPLGARKAFHAGRWEALLHRARALQSGVRTSELPTSAQLRARACAQLRQGDLSRARRTLTSASLAPGDEATLAALSDPDRRPPQPRRPLPPPPSLPATARPKRARQRACPAPRLTTTKSCWPMRPRLRCCRGGNEASQRGCPQAAEAKGPEALDARSRRWPGMQRHSAFAPQLVGAQPGFAQCWPHAATRNGVVALKVSDSVSAADGSSGHTTEL